MSGSDDTVTKLPQAPNSTDGINLPEFLRPKVDEKVSNDVPASDTLKILEKAAQDRIFPELQDDESQAQ